MLKVLKKIRVHACVRLENGSKSDRGFEVFLRQFIAGKDCKIGIGEFGYD